MKKESNELTRKLSVYIDEKHYMTFSCDVEKPKSVNDIISILKTIIKFLESPEVTDCKLI